MKWILSVLVLFFAVFANADDVLDVKTQCNNGPISSSSSTSSSSSANRVVGLADTSCYLIATTIRPGFDLPVESDGPSSFYFDQNYSIQLKNVKKPVPIRFVVYEDESNYNAVQAIVQTAYATKAPLSVIFANPTLRSKPYDLDTYLTKKRKKDKNCYTSEDVKEGVIALNCPILSIQLHSN
jgi:hypothetical protein